MTVLRGFTYRKRRQYTLYFVQNTIKCPPKWVKCLLANLLSPQDAQDFPQLWLETSPFTHHVDILVHPSSLAVAAAAEAAVAVVAGRSPVPAVRMRRMRRTWRRTKMSRVEGRLAGTGSSGWAPPTGSSEWRRENILYQLFFYS